MKNGISLDRTSFFNFLCAILMLAVVVLQFTPFWHYGDQSASINAYVWFPTEHAELEAYLDEEMGYEVNINDVILAPILMLLLGAAGVAFCFLRNDLPIASIASILFGIVGIFGYLLCDVFRCGSNWGLHLTLCFVALAAGITATICFFRFDR